MHAAFKHTLERLLQEVFNGEEAAQAVLKTYIILQVLSDASFCLERWQAKGGGAERKRQVPLEKWLWRAIWDLYICSDILSTAPL